MGNARPEPPPRNRNGGRGGSAARGSSGPSKGPRTRASVSAMRSDGNDRGMGTPSLPARAGPALSGLRRQQKGAAAEAQQGLSKTIQNKASNSPALMDSNRTSSSKVGAKELMTEHDRARDITIPSKKRKRMDAKTYRSLFKPSIKANATDAVSTPDRSGKENTCIGRVSDRNIDMLCEGGSLVEKRKKNSSDTDQCTTPSSEVHPHKPTDTCSQNIVAESGLPADAGDRPIDPARHICSVCGMSGTLKPCAGKDCKRRYHVSCLDPSLESLSPIIFFCTICMKKRLQFDLHSSVDDIESLWDVKEGMQNGKHYFVKYKNLAHVHNCWVPETDVINGAPGGSDLLSLFNMRNHKEKTNWKEEWTKPHRLLKKRPLKPLKSADDLSRSPGTHLENCNVEWLVKWRGLGYDGVTWELETSPFLCTHEADELKRNYENRHKAANHASISTRAKVKQSPFQNTWRLPDECRFVFDNDHLHSINQLRKSWHKSCGAVLIDDKECVIKTILFTMSLLSDACQPFLIVTSPASLSLWEDQFNHLAPFINVVVYDGGKEMLKLIQNLEFYENGSCMLQILLSQPDAILEDSEAIERIGWEAVIVDYHPNSPIKYFEQLKKFSTDFRMLLLSSPVKDNLQEYVSLLAFLNPGKEVNSHYDDSDEALVLSKKTFISHIAYEQKMDTSNFLEHWVPAYISQVQLKIYCSILLSESSVLQSQMGNDNVGALYDIFWSLSKCCDHPYLVDNFLHHSPINNDDLTDTRASGKLLLLDNMLKEIRNKRLRAIVLYQCDGSHGADGNPVGNMLESFVRHRFGPNSYERVECHAKMLRKLAAINVFNDKAKGRFVFMIESRACLPSVKLSSVDFIIIYGSDWNPLDDLKALKRIAIQSQLKYLNIFRLYTPFTVEEKSLVLAKQGMLIDTKIQDVMTTLGHSLLSWGASVLFNNFDGLQQDNSASISSERDTLLIAEVISEFLTKLPTNTEDSTKINSTSISKASMSAEFYSRNITLIGEKERVPELDGDPSKFWSNLLNGKSSHIMLQNKEEPAKIHTEGTDEPRRKRIKIDKAMGLSLEVLPDNSDIVLPENCTTLNAALQPPTRQKIGVENVKSTPKSLHVQLKQELSKLIKGLQLPDNVSVVVERFFEYLLKNHLVSLEPKGILHALNIALCWHAASHRKYNVDRRESLTIAKKYLNYECNEELAVFVYETLKKKFTDEEGETSSKFQETVENTKFSWQDTSTDLSNDQTFPKEAMNLHGNFTNGTPPEGSFGAELVISEVQELVMEKRSDLLVDNVFSLREKNIRHRQRHELSELEKQRQNKVSRLKEICNLVLEHIRKSQIDEDTMNSKMKKIIQWFTMLMYAFLEHMRLQYDKLETLQYNTWSKERHLKEKLEEEAKLGQLDPAFDRCIALPESNFVMEEFIYFKEQNDGQNVIKSYASYCQQPSNETSLPISSHAVEAAVDFTENIICSSPGCVGLQRTGGSSTVPENDDSINQVVMASGVLQREMETPTLTLDSPILRTSSDDVSEACHRQDTATGLSQEVSTPYHLAVGDVSMGVKANDDVTVASDQLQPETQFHSVLHSPAALPVLHPEIESSTSVLDASLQRTHPDDSSQTGHEPGTAPDLSQRGGTSSFLRDAREGAHTNNRNTVSADHLAHSESSASVAPQSQPIFPREVGTKAKLPSMSSQESTHLAAQQNVALSQYPHAEAEQTGLLSTKAAADLQLEMQPSPSFLNAPLQTMLPDNRSQTDCQSTRATGLMQGDAATSCHLVDGMGASAKNDGHFSAEATETEYSTYTAHNSATLVLSMEVGTKSRQSSMPTQKSTDLPAPKCTSLPAQQNSTTSQYPPAEAEAEAAVIMVTEAARGCQSEMQPSTSMQDQPREAEQESTSIQDQPKEAEQESISMQDQLKEPEQESTGLSTSMQNQAEEAEQESTGPSTSMQDQPEEAERASTETTDLSHMPMLQSTTCHESVNPPYEGVEPAVSLGMVTAHELQSEIQPSTSMQDQPVEAQGTGNPGTMVAQDLQLEMQPSTTLQHLPLERRHHEDRSQIGFDANMASDPGQASEPPVAMIVCNYRLISYEPLKNELERLKCCIDELNKSHAQKKALLLNEQTQEIEKARRKYDSLLKEEDSSYRQVEMELDDLYKKVHRNQTLAGNFREKFILSTAAQGRSTSPVMRQQLQSSQQAHAGASVLQATALPVASLSATRPPVFNLLHSPGTNVQPSMVGRPSTSWPFQPEPILPSNAYRGAPSAFVPTPRPHGGYRAAGARTRAPTHLRQPRMPPPYALIHTNQQQLPVYPAITSFRQFAHGNMDDFSSSGLLAGALVSSMAPSSVHYTMLSSSNPCPALPVSSLMSGALPDSMLSSRANPIFRATQPSSPNMVFCTPSSTLAGAQITGVNQSGSESASQSGWLPTRLGLPNNPTGRGTNAEVVCLSDDES